MLFDNTNSNLLQHKHFVLLLKMMVVGYCRLTGQPLPATADLDKYFKILFNKSELNKEHTLELKEIIDWLESSIPFRDAVLLFQVPTKLGYVLYRPLRRLPERDLARAMQLLERIYKSDRLLASVGLALVDEEDREDRAYLQTILPRFELSQVRKDLAVPPSQARDESSRLRTLKSMDVSKMTLTDLRERDLTLKRSHLQLPRTKRRTNRTILKGLSKTHLFNLCDYFNGLSNRKGELTIADFLEAMNLNEKVPNMRAIAGNLFNNYLDARQSGRVSFLDFITRLYPALSQDQLTIVQNWAHEYEKMLYCEFRRTKKVEEKTKFKVLPRSCMAKIL
jgi:hypothetical protein